MRLRPLGQLILGLWLLGLPGSAGPLPAAGFLQAVDLKHLPGGGFSAIHMIDPGHAVILGDKGMILRLEITRKEGRITEVTSGKLRLLRDTSGRPLIPGQSDTEGLAMAPDGRAWISTEGTARVLAYDQIEGVPARMPRPKVFARFLPNTAFEALALTPQGVPWLIPEAPLDGDFPVFTWSGSTWDLSFHIAPDGPWLVADACFDDTGRLYLLERLFAGPAGFASRIRRFEVGAEGPQAPVVVLRTALGTHDNLEGLSIWRDAEGLVASMVSDDNLLKVFRSELVEYRLPE